MGVAPHHAVDLSFDVPHPTVARATSHDRLEVEGEVKVRSVQAQLIRDEPVTRRVPRGRGERADAQALEGLGQRGEERLDQRHTDVFDERVRTYDELDRVQASEKLPGRSAAESEAQSDGEEGRCVRRAFVPPR